MADPSRGLPTQRPGDGLPRVWAAMGSLLPRSIREGVYEPACLDLWRAASLAPGSGRRIRVALTLAGYLAAAFWYAAPRYVSEVPCSRRAMWATRLGLAITALVLLLMVVPRFLYY